MMSQSRDSRLAIPVSFVMQIIGWVVAVLLTYGAVNARIAVTENNVSTLQSDVKEIKQDVKQLLRRP